MNVKNNINDKIKFITYTNKNDIVEVYINANKFEIIKSTRNTCTNLPDNKCLIMETDYYFINSSFNFIEIEIKYIHLDGQSLLSLRYLLGSKLLDSDINDFKLYSCKPIKQDPYLIDI